MPDPSTPTDLPPVLRSRPPARGEAVVHLDYGLCRLGPHRRMELSDGPVDTVELRFRGGDTLGVPLTDAVRLWAYGASLPKSRLDPIGSQDWSDQQDERLAELGESLSALVRLQRARIEAQGAALNMPDAAVERAAQGFGHTLTAGQQAALDAVLADLRADRPMNRIVIGDVGCGKTEVAVRALLAVALSGGRGRLVAPTRMLARQHMDEIAPRAKALGLVAALWSGDLTEAEQADTHEAFGRGDIDIMVGTHGLAGEAFDADAFALTIIDEEQKYGAKLKDADGAGGNRLRLSATPIPRTLAEVRVGLADASLIEGYPAGRGRTDTHSLDDTDDEVRRAVEAELSRGGQVIALCARIKDTTPLRKRLVALCPDARIGRVHGRRKGRKNRAALVDFRAGRIDILVATTMLETGLNVPAANTMLVFQPHRFGLAQLHQLRGRVGRGDRNAHFLLVVEDGEGGASDFAKRVRALEQLDERGDGLRLALADSLLRGTGSLLDDEQSGHASAVGLEVYEYLLDRAADAPGASLPELMHSIPKVTGDGSRLFGDGEIDLNAVLADSRAALREPEATLRSDTASGYARIVAACGVLGAWKAGVTKDGVVFVRGDGETVEVSGDLAGVLEKSGRGRG
ncbi:MAG: helicase-related protein [Pseudomonadota bacterium]